MQFALISALLLRKRVFANRFAVSLGRNRNELHALKILGGKSMSNQYRPILLVVLTAIVAGGAVYLIKPSSEVHSTVSIDQMRDIAELATTEWTMSAFVEREFTSQGVKRFRSDYVIAACTGKVRGRVNMEKATINVEDEADIRHVKVHFNQGSVSVSGVEFDTSDPNAFRTISCAQKLPSALGNSANVSQVDSLRKEGMKQIRENAIEVGIVKKTKENATTLLGNFFASLGLQATITYDPEAFVSSKSELSPD